MPNIARAFPDQDSRPFRGKAVADESPIRKPAVAILETLAKAKHYSKRYLYRTKYRMLPDLSQPGGAACGQDVFIAELLAYKRNGVFFDIWPNDLASARLIP